jgi:hypothetical protein
MFAIVKTARVSFQVRGREFARLDDPLFVAGCMLYWAEDAKHRNRIRGFDIEDEAIRLTCNLFADHLERQREIEQFWLDIAALPQSCLCKSSVNVYSKHSQKKRRNTLPYGTCRLSVGRTWLTQTIYGGIQELGGFTRDAWLE